MYADIFGTIPVAEALFAKGAQLGAILSFMMAVTTLSLPSMIMLRKAVKPRLLALFIGICTGGIIIVGYLSLIHIFPRGKMTALRCLRRSDRRKQKMDILSLTALELGKMIDVYKRQIYENSGEK